MPGDSEPRSSGHSACLGAPTETASRSPADHPSKSPWQRSPLHDALLTVTGPPAPPHFLLYIQYNIIRDAEARAGAVERRAAEATAREDE